MKQILYKRYYNFLLIFAYIGIIGQIISIIVSLVFFTGIIDILIKLIIFLTLDVMLFYLLRYINRKSGE